MTGANGILPPQQPQSQPPRRHPLGSNDNNMHMTPVHVRRSTGSGKEFQVREVWRENVETEFRLLREAIVTHPFVAMDVEFPGVVARSIPAGADPQYQTLRCNVDLLTPIQVAFVLTDANGSFPTLERLTAKSTGTGKSAAAAASAGEAGEESGAKKPTSRPSSPTTTSGGDGSSAGAGNNNNNNDNHSGEGASGTAIGAWQFNFRFSLDDDMYAPGSVELLERAGLDFAMHKDRGIDPAAFGELLISSGLALQEEVTWITFHSAFAIAFLVKLMTCRDLPTTVGGFVKNVGIYLPNVVDVRHLVSVVKSPQWKGGLDALAGEHAVARDGGPAHQAASDALLTSAVYFALRSRYFPDTAAATTSKDAKQPAVVRDAKGSIYGLRVDDASSSMTAYGSGEITGNHVVAPTPEKRLFSALMGGSGRR